MLPDITQLNLLAGWIGMLAGVVSRSWIGWFFHREESLGVWWSTDSYGSEPFPETSPYYKDMLSPTTSA